MRRRAVRAAFLLDERQEISEVCGAIERAVDRDSRPGQFLLTGSVRSELSNEMWADTGPIVRLSMYGLTERKRLEVELAARPLFSTCLADAGDARLPGDDVDALFPLPAEVRGRRFSPSSADAARRTAWSAGPTTD